MRYNGCDQVWAKGAENAEEILLRWELALFLIEWKLAYDSLVILNLGKDLLDREFWVAGEVVGIIVSLSRSSLILSK